MNHGWEKKILGDVCTVIGGATPNTNIPEYWNGSFNWVTPAELHGEKYFSSSERKLTSEGAKSANLQLLPVGTVLLSSRAPIGKVAITKEPSYCNQGFKNLVCGESIYNEYLFYYLGAHTTELQKEGSGTTFKEISTIKTEQFKILLPPLAFQHKIAIELDKLNELIELKRNQLKDLDTLAQSLFYETFGDPIENPKGWEIKPFGKLIRLKSGAALSAKNFCDGLYPVYGGNGIAGYHNTYNISGHNIIIGRVGALCGNVRLIDADIFVTDNAFIVNLQQNMNLRFLERLLILLDLRKYANAAAQPVISNTSLKVINVPIPPISLQNKFAVKVEAIEAQKRLIESMIADLETLLASRMDYWFND